MRDHAVQAQPPTPAVRVQRKGSNPFGIILEYMPAVGGVKLPGGGPRMSRRRGGVWTRLQQISYYMTPTACRNVGISEMWWLRVGCQWAWEAHMCQRYPKTRS